MSASIDILSITTPLPATSFGVDSISGSECLSRPYGYTISLHSGTALLDPNSLLDKPVSLTLGDPNGQGRYISGIVRAVKQLTDSSKALWRYELSVVPKIWFLSQTQDCRFFQKMAIPDIVKSIFDTFSVTYSTKLTGSYTARDYCVMFNESYLHFVQRILEDEGIFYFFTHDANGHTLVLADSNTAFQTISIPDVYLDEQGAGLHVLSTWHLEDHTAIGAVRKDDYNPETDQPVPGAISGTENTLLTPSGASARKHYAWPAVRGTNADASARVKSQMLSHEAAARVFNGNGRALDFFAGGKFTLQNDPTTSAATDYIIRSVTYTASDTAGGSGMGGSSSVSMSCTAFPAATTWREEPSAAPPLMAGIYTAQVIGPSGEEIYTDDLGRIQVQFPSDNHGDIRTDKTIWVRVVHPWAGKSWGAQFTPRIGMEVAVAFLEGDVNRPVAVGSLYNNTNTPVFAAADKNKSGWRTHSTQNGGTSNFSELSFDDTMGSEVFFLHAEKDFKLEVENDQTLTIQHDRSVTVTNDETVTINGKKTDTVKGNHSLTVSEGNLSTTVSQGNLSTTVSTGNESLTVSSGSISHTAGQSITLKVGANTLEISTTGITLTVGANTVQLAPAGVTINGTQVNITGTASTGVTGTGMLNLTGGVVLINS
jgi:type VI secretion system secreted protein VgrG